MSVQTAVTNVNAELASLRQAVSDLQAEITAAETKPKMVRFGQSYIFRGPHVAGSIEYQRLLEALDLTCSVEG